MAIHEKNMTIIADSGSTKTTWMDVASGNKMVTEGLNPHFSSDKQILATCRYVLEELSIPNHQFSLFFYGAGCGNDFQRHRMEELLSIGFSTNDIHVETDMLGACRAVSGDRTSIVAILGTGSNACYYDGKKIEWQPKSTGYIMGDSGSANHVGRILLNDYLTQKMPEEVRKMFYSCFPMSDDQMIDKVYHSSNPNRFLASLAPFAVNNGEQQYCNGVIHEALSNWHDGLLTTIRNHVNYQKGYIHFVGGFAKAIEQKIRDFFINDSLRVGTIVADPIEGLTEYHRIKNS